VALSDLNAQPVFFPPLPLTKLWIYTNYDCNLRCSYCLAKSSPQASRRAISRSDIRRLVDEAVALGFEHVYFTGGEPFLLEEIFEILAYASERIQTSVLTNAMLLRGKRLEKLCAIRNDNLIVQISLDGNSSEQHDSYRGAGSWKKTVEGIHNLQENLFRIRLSTTQTPANEAHLSQICSFHQALGIAEEDHFIRPLAKRGFSQEGLEVCKETVVPEITVSQDGIYWHPLSTDPDMKVRTTIFPLVEAVSQVQAELEAISRASQGECLNTFQ
jgi:MoaA/NifB/PqqE/SkfB family radical SAM enzyme